MPEIRLRYIIGGLAAGLLIWWGVATVLEKVHAHQGSQNEAVSHQQDQEAQSHAQAAQSIPDHAAQIAEAQAGEDAAKKNADRLKSELAALRRKMASQAGHDSQPPSAASGSAVDDVRDAVIAKQDEVIASLEKDNSALRVVNESFTTALTDEQARSMQWEAAYQHEKQARLAQEAATNAWKSAVKESRWRGRIEGFAAGVALGYAGGKL